MIIDHKTREKILASVHERIGEGVAQASLGGHLGRDKMASKLEQFWWPGIKGEIESVCQTCEVCQKAAPRLDRVSANFILYLYQGRF